MVVAAVMHIEGLVMGKPIFFNLLGVFIDGELMNHPKGGNNAGVGYKTGCFHRKMSCHLWWILSVTIVMSLSL